MVSTCQDLMNMKNNLTACYVLSNDIVNNTFFFLFLIIQKSFKKVLYRENIKKIFKIFFTIIQLQKDCSSVPSFPAIGSYANPFKGSLDGQNHAIIGFNINSTIDGSYSDYNVALFGALCYATVKNLFFLDANVFVSGQICYINQNYCTVGILAGKTFTNLIFLAFYFQFSFPKVMHNTQQ